MWVVLPPLFKLLGSRPGAVVRWTIAIVILGFFVSGMVWAIRIYCRYSLAVPACLLERLPARQALKRSKWLSKKAIGRIFLIFFLMGTLALGLCYAIQAPIALYAASYPGVFAIVLQLLL